MLDFDGDITVRKSLVKAVGFIRHPFEMVDRESVKPTNGKYLIGVVRYITNVGRSIQQRICSRTLDFYLANESSSTHIFDDADIPKLKALSADDCMQLTKEVMPVEYSKTMEGTLENLLMWARNRRNDSVAFICQVKIDHIRTKKGWNFPSCGEEKCKKGVARNLEEWWYEACNQSIEYHVLSFTCWKMHSSASAVESACSSTLDAITNLHTSLGKRLCKDPYISTPLKPSEEKKTRRLQGIYSKRLLLLVKDLLLMVGVAGTIIVMLYRIWDVSAVTGRYLSTNLVVSDARPNKEECRISKDDTFMLDFDGDISVRKSLVKAVGFIRHPFEMVDLESFKPTNGKYLIGVVRYITNVGRSIQQRICSRTLDFYLANESMQLTKEVMPVEYSKTREGTLENLLMWARNRRNDSVAFIYQVKIDHIRTKKGWNFPSCGEEKCKKGVTRNLKGWWYRLELRVFDETTHVVVVMFNETASELVKCLADSIAESLDKDPSLPPTLTNTICPSHTLELKSHTYYEHGTFESFTCWKMHSSALAVESACSSTLDAITNPHTSLGKRLCKDPYISTPLKPSEEKKTIREALEDSATDLSPSPAVVLQDYQGGDHCGRKRVLVLLMAWMGRNADIKDCVSVKCLSI
nr:hypothetical protein [Tanacetum cinerariifolium]